MRRLATPILHAISSGHLAGLRSQPACGVRLFRFARDDDVVLGSTPLNTVMYTLLEFGFRAIETHRLTDDAEAPKPRRCRFIRPCLQGGNAHGHVGESRRSASRDRAAVCHRGESGTRLAKVSVSLFADDPRVISLLSLPERGKLSQLASVICLLDHSLCEFGASGHPVGLWHRSSRTPTVETDDAIIN